MMAQLRALKKPDFRRILDDEINIGAAAHKFFCLLEL
jgi:hypothetical protein